MALKTRALTLTHGPRRVLDGLDIAPDPHGITAIVGPNGSGKSTLLRCLMGLTLPSGGEVTLADRPVRDWPRRQLAQRLAFLPQSPTAPDGLSLRDLVAHGRFARAGLWGGGAADRATVDTALEQTNLSTLADRSFSSLSGGERQRGWIAMALAQQSDMLLLDEPTTWLDIGHQAEVLDLLRRLNRDRGLGIVMVLHDMNQAALYADRMIALKDGVVHADGPPLQVLTSDLLHALFRVRAVVVQTGTGDTRRPHFVVMPQDG